MDKCPVPASILADDDAARQSPRGLLRELARRGVVVHPLLLEPGHLGLLGPRDAYADLRPALVAQREALYGLLETQLSLASYGALLAMNGATQEHLAGALRRRARAKALGLAWPEDRWLALAARLMDAAEDPAVVRALGCLDTPGAQPLDHLCSLESDE